MSGRAVEAAGDVDTLLLDKTGTITLGNRMATEFIPIDGVGAEALADAAQLASLADETPEGRSIVVLAKEKYGLRGRDVTEIGARFIPFSAETRMSGCDLDGRRIRKGAADAIVEYVHELGGTVSSQVEGVTHGISDSGGTPLVVAEGNTDPRYYSSQGRGQGRHQRALRALPGYGYSHGDDYRRQSAHCGGDR